MDITKQSLKAKGEDKMVVERPIIQTLAEGLREEKNKLQKIIYETINAFESATGCHVVSIDLDNKYDGRLGQTKTTYVSFNIKL